MVFYEREQMFVVVVVEEALLENVDVLPSLSWVVQRLHLLFGLLGFIVPVLVSRCRAMMHLLCWQGTCACCCLLV